MDNFTDHITVTVRQQLGPWILDDEMERQIVVIIVDGHRESLDYGDEPIEPEAA